VGSGVEGVAEAVAEEGEGKHHQGDGDGREDDEAGEGEDGAVGLEDHRAPAGGSRVDTEADEAERGLCEDRARHAEGHDHDDRPEGVREEVAPHDRVVGGAEGPRRLDELAFLQREDLASNQACDVHPLNEPDDEEERKDVAAENASQKDDEEQVREGEHQVCEAHQQVVDAPAEVAGCGANGYTDGEDDGLREEANRHGEPGPVNEAAEPVAAQVVGAHQVVPRWLDEGVEQVLLVGIVGHDQGRDDREKEEEADDAKPYERETVAYEAVKGVSPEPARFYLGKRRWF
jgi:hypothetical protein